MAVKLLRQLLEVRSAWEDQKDEPGNRFVLKYNVDFIGIGERLLPAGTGYDEAVRIARELTRSMRSDVWIYRNGKKESTVFIE